MSRLVASLMLIALMLTLPADIALPRAAFAASAGDINADDWDTVYEDPIVPEGPTRSCGKRPCLRALGTPGGPAVGIYQRSRAWADVIGKIPAGATDVIDLGETAVSASIPWRYVEYNGVRGWVPSQFLSK